MREWYFVAGEGSWTIPNVVDCTDPECGVTPIEENCVILYSECNFKGENTRICSDSPFTDIDYEVKSISIPNSKTIYLYNLPCFKGKNAKFSQDVKCIDNINFEFLEMYGIRLIEEEFMMLENPGQMQAKYKRSNLRKAKGLSTYKQ